MRYLVIILALALSTPAIADITQNSPSQGQDQAQGQQQGQAQGQAAVAAQAQGQLGVVGQKAENNQGVTVGGDDIDTVTAVWPVVPSSPNKEEKALYSLFGGIGSNKTEEHIRIQQAMQIAETLFKNKVITEDEYKVDLQLLYKQLKASIKPQKLFGVLPIAQRGCSILNGCGLLAW